MPLRPSRAVAVRALATGLAAAGAAAVLAVPTTASAATPVGRPVVKLHVTSTRTVAVTRTLRPGLVHFRNTGGREVFVIRREHEGPTQLATYLNSDSAAVAKRATTRFDFVTIICGRTDLWTSLPRGTYYLADAGGSRVKAAKIRTVTVTGRRVDAARPSAVGVLVGPKGRVSTWTRTSHTAAVRFRNGSPDYRVFVTLRVAGAATDAQMRDLVAHPTEAKLDAVVDQQRPGVTFPAQLGAGHGAIVRPGLSAGRWVVVNQKAFGAGSTLPVGALGVLQLS